jgi:hypothetical protein
MNLDLTGLAEVGRKVTGEPLMVPLELISCDLGQPRQHIDVAELHELADFGAAGSVS